MTAQLATTAYKDPDVQRLARDADEQLRALVTARKATITAQYTEPMYLSANDEPYGIICIRVRQRDNPEAVVAHTQRVSFVWDASRRAARIDDIGGMSTGATFYVFDFLVVE